MNRLLHHAVEEEIGVFAMSVKSGSQAVKRDEGGFPFELGLPEDKVEVLRWGVEIHIEHGEHFVFARYAVENPVEDQVRIVLISCTVVRGRGHVQRRSDEATFDQRRKGPLDPPGELFNQTPLEIPDRDDFDDQLGTPLIFPVLLVWFLE
jgi:hypothetical protein